MQPGGSGDPKTRPDTTPAEMTQRELAASEGKPKDVDSTEFYSELAKPRMGADEDLGAADD